MLVLQNCGVLRVIRNELAKMRAVVVWLALVTIVACLHASLGAEAAPATIVRPSRNGKRAAEDRWSELTEGEGRANDHEHWERIVRRSAVWYDPYYEDDTQHIVDVQDYYRYVLEQGWVAEPRRQYVWAQMLQNFRGEQARIQIEDDYTHVQKRIPGRYIVMLDSAAGEEMLDRAIAVLMRAHAESDGMIRAEHITPMKNLALGFTATMNSKAVALVS